MKKLLALAAAATVTVFAAPAFADTNASIGFSQVTIGDDDTHAFTARGGWTEGHFGVEVEGAWSSGDAKTSSGTSLQMRSEAGLFGTAQIDVADTFTLLGRVGLATVSIKERSSTPSTHIEVDAGGVAYGVAGIWMFSDNNGVRVDYTQYQTDAGKNAVVRRSTSPSFYDEDPQIWSVSLVHRFGGGAAPAAEAK